MPHYAVRITHSYEVCSRVVGLWALKSDRVAVFEHSGERTGKTHIHLALYGTSIDKKQLRNIAAAAGLDVKGNENCSFKPWDGRPDNYCYYMTKGTINASYIKYYTTTDVDEWKTRWVKPREYIKETSWMKLYEEFSEEGHCIIHDDDDDKVNTLIAHAKRFVMSKLHVWCPQYGTYMNCCVRTYAWKHHISLPTALIFK